METFYPNLSSAGFCIIDDFGSHASQAGEAVEDYRKAHRIEDAVFDIDGWAPTGREACRRRSTSTRASPSAPLPRRSPLPSREQLIAQAAVAPNVALIQLGQSMGSGETGRPLGIGSTELNGVSQVADRSARVPPRSR